MSVWFDRAANRWRIRIKRGGREVARYLPPGVTKQQAEEAHTNLMREFFNQTALNKKPRYTLVEALTKYMEEYNVHNKHPRNAAVSIRVMLPLIKGKLLDQTDLVGEAIRKKSDWAPATRNRRLALLRRVTNLAFKQWKWLDRPINIELLPEHNERHVRLSRTQVEDIARRAGAHLPLAKHWILLAAYTGMRQGEIQGLTAANVVDGELHLHHTKNNRPRVVPLNAKAKKALDGWLAAEYRPNTRWLYTQFERACAELSLTDVRFHDLRHFFASELVNAGVDLYTVGKILGHISPVSTRRYAHLDTKALTAAVRRVK